MDVPFNVLYETQPNVIKLLNNSFKKKRLVHTYLFEGAQGTAKLDAAYYLASLLLCSEKNKPCLACKECKRVIKGTHSNIIEVKPEKGVIRKEQADMLIKEFSLKAADGKNRVYIIQEIDKATASAANALLKFLEESGQGNYGILLTENSYNVLPTIKSRSQIISFVQLWPEVIANKLVSLGIDDEIAKILSNITNSVDECLEMINEGKILDIIDLLKKTAYNFLIKERPPLLVFFEDGKFLLSETDKRYHNIFIDLLIAFFSNLLYLRLKQNEKIMFKSIIHDFLNISVSPNKIITELEKILEFKQRLRYNINIELFYVQMLTEIQL